MSLYFEGFLAFDLKPQTPQVVIDALSYMVATNDHQFNNPPRHPFFEVEGWRQFLDVQSRQSDQPGFMGSQLGEVHRPDRHGLNLPRLTLSFRRVMHDDVEFYVLWWRFLDWIAPCVETEGFIGYYRETYSLHPVTIYMRDGELFAFEVTGMPKTSSGRLWPGHPNNVQPGWLRDIPS